jgi:protein Tex
LKGSLDIAPRDVLECSVILLVMGQREVMHEAHIPKIAQELSLTTKQVQATADLLNEGATVPFIARYRKEVTGSLDEVAITTVRDRLNQLIELDKRREAILKSLEERGQLTDELKGKILSAETLAILEDIYLPYRPKRRTRATIAKERGLEPLAQRLFAQEDMDLSAEASAFVDPEKGVISMEDALAGARDIIAEWVNEDQTARARMRDFFSSKAVFKSKVIPEKEADGIKYKDYFDWQEPVSTAPSHRVLAMRRGENEDFLTLRVFPPEDEALEILDGLFVKGEGPASQQVRMSVHDSYKRLLSPSMETEIRLETKKRADEEAIRVFVENVRQLLLAPPLGQKNVLAIDPGFRTGCKVVCLDRQGKLLHTETTYPLQSEKAAADAGAKICEMSKRFHIEAIAVGNGTAGRETEAFIRSLDLSKNIQVVMVNESGASVYSASEVAREEFPDQDVTVRGAVSIGRRLMDPLAELVKIDPKSIGVGQYQHDVDQGALKNSLDDVVISCVNRVGVEVNTASKQLLTYVSGLGPQLARGIVEYRNEHGPFRSRQELKQIPRLGPKAYEQAAGFLRIRDGENPLDRSAVHPESYPIVDAMVRDLGCSVIDLMRDEKLRKKIDLGQYISEKAGLPTLNDILSELSKPGRDPREQLETFRFAEGIEKIEDVKPGMKLPGIVTNITAFGLFVDIGVHQDGLVHISEVSQRFIKNPVEVVSVHQKVMVTVLGVDLARKRISLSMKDRPAQPGVVSKREERNKEGKKQERKQKEKSTFTNNPFASALRNKNQ